MLNYSPIEEEVEVQRIPPKAPPETVIATKKGICHDETECNFVVMFFVIGVIILAAMDNVKK